MSHGEGLPSTDTKLIGVRGSPLEDIRAPERVFVVTIDGKAFRHDR